MGSQHSLAISMVIGRVENPNKSQFSFSGPWRQAPDFSYRDIHALQLTAVGTLSRMI